ncbi:MAG: translation initiation factor IF-3 [Gammaproteobacteria bacterium]|nr:translation initiation factor IF-3 [Gammaproteobacteria bacterium]MDH3987183.1 translation initiation factor IF-3 [Gammaproteobacteria bacterium]
MAAKKPQHRINEKIVVPEVRVINQEGEQVGIVSIDEANKLANENNLDLVEISPNAEPPVCRIMDYGKFRFEENKKLQTAKKKQKQTQVKEIKFRPGTDIGDYNIKLRKLISFLEDGDRTKVTLRFRGREMAHQELGMQLLMRVKADLEEYGTVEQEPKMEGRLMVMVLAPRKNK